MSDAGFQFVSSPPQSESRSKYDAVVQAAFDNPQQWIKIEQEFKSRGGPETIRRLRRDDRSPDNLKLEFRITQVRHDPGQSPDEPYFQLYLRAVPATADRSATSAAEVINP